MTGIITRPKMMATAPDVSDRKVVIPPLPCSQTACVKAVVVLRIDRRAFMVLKPQTVPCYGTFFSLQ
jgi:hypothetical protein